MAITSVGTLGSGVASTSGASFTLVTTTNALSTSGDMAVLRVVTDNVSTVDGNSNDHTSVTGGTGVWTKIYEQTNTVGGAAGDGVTVSLWVFRSTGTNAIGTTFTINHATTVDRCASAWKFTVAAGNDLALALAAHGYTTDAGNGFGSNTISGLASASRLYLMAGGKEANSTTLLTPSTSFTEFTGTRSRNNAAAVLDRGEFRINTSTGETSNPTMAVTGDTAAIFVALFEIVPLTNTTGADSVNNLSDTYGQTAGIPKSFSDDANNLSDATRLDYGNLHADSYTLSDAATVVLGVNLTASDSVNNLVDGAVRVIGVVATGVDSLQALTDALVKLLSYELALADSEASNWADSHQLLLAQFLALSDTNSLTDAAALGFGLVTSDTLVSLTDAATTQLGTTLALADSTTALTDALTQVEGDLLAFTDGIQTPSDSIVLGRGLLLADSIATLTDAYTQRATGLLAFTDSVNLTDTTSLGIGLLTSDTITLDDAVVAAASQGPNRTVSASDTLSLTDAVAITLTYRLTTSDNASNWADSVAKVVGLGLILSDNAQALTDAQSARLAHLLQPSDQLTLTDSLVTFGTNALALTDSFALIDTFAKDLRGPDFNFNPTDSLVLADSIAISLNAQVRLSVLLSDAITLTDHQFHLRSPYTPSIKRQVVVPSAPRGTTVTGERNVQVPATSRTTTIE